MGRRRGRDDGQSQSFQSFILLANPALAPANIRITYLRTAAAPVVKTYTVNPTSRLNVAVNSEVPELVTRTLRPSSR